MSDRFGNIPIQNPESNQAIKKPSKKPPRPKIARKSARTTRRPKERKWGWIAGIVVVSIFIFYNVFGFFGVPYYLSKILPGQFYKKTAMVLEPSAVTFNPYSFRFSTGVIRIHPESGPSILSLQSIEAKLAPIALLKLNFVCDSIAINGVNLNIAREVDGTYNFKNFFGNVQNGRQDNIADVTGVPFFFSLNNISITDSTLIFNDRPTGKTHKVEKIQLDLPSYSNIPFRTDKYLHPRFSAIVNGSPIELTGQAGIGDSQDGDQTTRLTMNLKDLNLSDYSDYLPFKLPWEVTKGTTNGTIDLLFDPNSAAEEKLSIGFTLQIAAAELNKKNGTITLSIPIARLQGSVHPLSKRALFKEVVLKEPLVQSFPGRITVEPDKTAKQNIQNVDVDSVPKIPYNFQIDQLLVDNGGIQFYKDDKEKLQPDSTWNSLQLSLKSYFSFPVDSQKTSRGSFNLSGEKEGTSSYFSWQGQISKTESITGHLIVEKMDCNEFLKFLNKKSIAQLQGTADLQGELTIINNTDQIFPLRFSLQNTKIAIDDFALSENKTKFLTAASVNLAPVNLNESTVSLGNIQFQKAKAQFIYGQLPASFTFFTKGDNLLQGLDFEGDLSVTLPKTSEQLVFTGVSIKANSLDRKRTVPENLSVSGKTAAGGVFQAQGTIDLFPFSLALETGFRSLNSKNIFQLFSISPLLQKFEGGLSGKGHLSLPGLNFVGELQFTDLSGRDRNDAPLHFQNVHFQDLNYTADPFHLGIRSTVLNQAEIVWKISNTDNDPIQYLRGFLRTFLPDIDQNKNDGRKITVSPLDIQEITIANSKIAVEDPRLSPSWKADVSNFSGKIQDLHMTRGSNNSTFSFSGKLDDSPFTISGQMDPFAVEDNGMYKVSLENYPLASFHKQLSASTDIDTSRGKFKLSLNSTRQDQQTIISGNLSLLDVHPTDVNSESALPLALLTDTDNTIQLPLDFSITQPTPTNNLINEILASFQRLVLKGSISPLLLATGNFTDLIDNEFIEFNPGEFMLSDAGQRMLLRYGALLLAHPNVGLILSGGVDPKVDRPAMEKSLYSLEQQRIARENEKLLEIWQDKKALYERKLAEKQKVAAQGKIIIEEDIPSDVLTGFKPLKPEPVVVDDAMLLELGQRRVDILNQYFTTQLALEPSRFTIKMLENMPAETELQINGVSIALQAVNP